MTPLTKLKFCVDGRWVESKTGNYSPLIDPATGHQSVLVPMCSREEIDDAVSSCSHSFTTWSKTPLLERAAVLNRFAVAIEANRAEIARLISRESGKVLAESNSEIDKTIESIKYACSASHALLGSSYPNPASSINTLSYREAVGVFAAVVPFNFPAMIPFGWILPYAVVCGNALLLKASSKVPSTAIFLLELLGKSGLPPGVVNLVMCGREETEYILSHPQIAGVSFVGSTEAGKLVFSKCAEGGKRVQVLAGAKNHAIVLDDANIPETAAKVTGAFCSCSGERCMALPVICVVESIAEAFVAALLNIAKKVKVGLPLHPESKMGPLINANMRDKVVIAINRAIAEGATLLLDGRGVVVDGGEGGFFIGPTIFDFVTEEMAIGRKEIFGPVLSIKRIKSIDEGINIINGSKFGKAASVFTSSGRAAKEFISRVDVGMVGVNIANPSPYSSFPFTGRRDSFFGDLNVLGNDGFMFFSQPKVVSALW